MAYSTITAFFAHYDDAAKAVRRLEATDIANMDISLVAGNPNDAYSHHATRKLEQDDEGVEGGAEVGATVGTLTGGGMGLLAGLGMLAIPGFGPVVAAGWLASILVGAGAGAALGGVVGALVGAGLSEEEALTYAEGLRRGGALVTARVDEADVDTVRTIFGEEGSVDLEREKAWREEEWTPPIGAAASTTTGLTTDLMPNPLDDERSETEIEVEEERLRHMPGTERSRS